MEFSKLTKRNHYEAITEQLRRQIEQGALKPGDKLPSTRELSERFGVGRSTTREALSALKAMGFIDIRQGGNCRVIARSPAMAGLPELHSLRMNRDTLLDLLEARQSLEVANAQLAAVRRSEADMRELRALVSRMEAAIGNDAEGERADLQFHLALAKATGNGVMVQLFESIMHRVDSAIRETRRVELFADRLVARQLYEEHAAIAEAVADGDKGRAARRMKSHLRHVERIWMKYL